MKLSSIHTIPYTRSMCYIGHYFINQYGGDTKGPYTSVYGIDDYAK